MNRHLCGWVLALVCPLSAVAARCETESAADWLPTTTVIYLEAAPAQTFVQLPLVKQLLSSERLRDVWRSPKVMQARGAMTMAELALGEKLPVVIQQLLAHGAAVTVDAENKGVALLAHAQDAETCRQLTKRFTQFIDSNAQRNGTGKRFERSTYRDFDVYEAKQGVIVVLDDWLLISNNPSLARKIVEQFREPKQSGLSTLASFSEVRQQSTAAATPLLWGWADVVKLREVNPKKIFKRPDENFLAELLIGGVLAAAREASTASLSLTSEASALQLQVLVPESAAIASSEYEFFFGDERNGRAPRLLKAEDTMLSIAAHRDIAELWRRAGDLFGQRTNDRLAQADATLTTLFSGRDFGEEILGAIQPGLQLIVARQNFESSIEPVPQIKLPAFALVTTLREPAEMQPQLKRIFTSLVGFINITGAMNQQPQLDIEILKEDSATFVTATYVADVDRPKDWKVPVQFNFSPTLAMIGDHAVLASTSTIARTAAEQLGHADKAPYAAGEDRDGGNGAATNTLLMVDGAHAVEALAINREQLVSQNMLKKGQSRAEAEKEFDTLLRLLGLIESLEISFDVGDGAKLTTVLRIKEKDL